MYALARGWVSVQLTKTMQGVQLMTTTGNDEPLTISVTPDGVLVVRGDIDITGGPVLDAAILEREPTGAEVVIDLHAVSFIDSSGLRSLLSAARRAQERGSRVILRNVGREIGRLLEITGTTDQFVIERDGVERDGVEPDND